MVFKTVMIPELKEIVEQEGDLKLFEYRGYACKIIRVSPNSMGHLCGYIGIEKGHELHGMAYEEIESKYNYEMPAHGGLTYAEYDEEGNYWIGFDCAHVGDLLPMYIEELGYSTEYETYKNMAFVEASIKEVIDFIEED